MTSKTRRLEKIIYLFSTTHIYLSTANTHIFNAKIQVSTIPLFSCSLEKNHVTPLCISVRSSKRARKIIVSQTLKYAWRFLCLKILRKPKKK